MKLIIAGTLALLSLVLVCSSQNNNYENRSREHRIFVLIFVYPVIYRMAMGLKEYIRHLQNPIT